MTNHYTKNKYIDVAKSIKESNSKLLSKLLYFVIRLISKIVKERNINQEVITALELDDLRKRSLVKKLRPKFLHKIALNFSGTIGSETYNQFVSNKYIYFSYILTKPAWAKKAFK
ncbi:MAG: hypothetical protein HN507_06635 [Flavobacteriaceae bacterium]|nr:hypothetical protein [Flavobacteriaceae bacterium]